jgi:hypothetical protein
MGLETATVHVNGDSVEIVTAEGGRSYPVSGKCRMNCSPGNCPLTGPIDRLKSASAGCCATPA